MIHDYHDSKALCYLFSLPENVAHVGIRVLLPWKEEVHCVQPLLVHIHHPTTTTGASILQVPPPPREKWRGGENEEVHTKWS